MITNPCYTLPDFASNIEIVLNRDIKSKEFFIKMLYNGKELPVCGHEVDPMIPCPVDTVFSHLNSKLVTPDLEILCFGQ
jgi:hypothetical protein